MNERNEDEAAKPALPPIIAAIIAPYPKTYPEDQRVIEGTFESVFLIAHQSVKEGDKVTAACAGTVNIFQMDDAIKTNWQGIIVDWAKKVLKSPVILPAVAIEADEIPAGTLLRMSEAASGDGDSGSLENPVPVNLSGRDILCDFRIIWLPGKDGAIDINTPAAILPFDSTWHNRTEASMQFFPPAPYLSYHRSGEMTFDTRYPKPSLAKRVLESVLQKKGGRGSKIRPLGEKGIIKYPSNLVTTEAVGALARCNDWEPGIKVDGRVYDFGSKLIRQNKNGEDVQAVFAVNGKELGEFLAKGGAQLVRCWYALWGRWYQDGESDPSGYVTMDVNQLCSDMGYQKHHKGGFKPESKRKAAEAFNVITNIEMKMIFPHPSKPGKVIRLSGPLWNRGIKAEEGDIYSDLFGSAREDSPKTWEPVALRYQPGDWFDNPDFKASCKAMGKMSADLLSLDLRYDEWAILIGGYLGTRSRANMYRLTRLRVETILQRVGLAQGNEGWRRAQENKKKFEDAMDRLVEVGVIQGWTYPEISAEEPGDMDDADAIADYAADESAVWRGNEWRRKLVEINWPKEYELDKIRLEERIGNHIAVVKRRK